MLHKRKDMTRKIKSNLLLLLLVLQGFASFADTAHILSKDAYLSIVRAYHPVVKQADIQVGKANAEIMRSRGAFDPKISTGADRKIFNNKLYYSYFSPELTIPTWYGVEFKAGVEDIQGDRLNPEVTQGKVSYAGVKVPVTSLLYDKRRATLQQAKLFREVSEAERKLSVNNLLYDAVGAYWNWVKEYRSYRAVAALVTANEERMKYLRVESEQGARATIDTVEGDAQYQVILQQQNNALIAYINAGLELSNYLWLENGSPAMWQESIAPDSAALESIPDMTLIPDIGKITATIEEHPKLRSINTKIDILEIDRKLKSQELLPKLNVNASMLSNGYGLPETVNSTFLSNNNKMGVEFGVPLFQREARGNLRTTKLKIEETNYEKNQLQWQLENKVRSYYNEFLSLQEQINNYQRAVNAYQTLLRGESLRFRTGESTLFILNSREIKALEATQKIIELKAKYQKAYAGIFYAAGMLE